MDAREPGRTASADEALDDLDASILGRVRDVYTAVDPMPDNLVERIRFAIKLEDVDVEVCRLREELGLLTGVRGDESGRTVTFEAESLTVMVTIGDDGPAVRLDGWMAPPGRWAVEVRTSGGPVGTTTDEQGRFVLDGLPHGLAQIVVSRPVGGERPVDGERPDHERRPVEGREPAAAMPPRPVVTPSIVI